MEVILGILGLIFIGWFFDFDGHAREEASKNKLSLDSICKQSHTISVAQYTLDHVKVCGVENIVILNSKAQEIDYEIINKDLSLNHSFNLIKSEKDGEYYSPKDATNNGSFQIDFISLDEKHNYLTLIIRIGEEMHAQIYDDVFFIKLKVKEGFCYTILNKQMKEMFRYIPLENNVYCIIVPSFSFE